MTQHEFLAHVAQCLDAASIPFMVAGSHGSSFYGQPRATNDVDIVIDPTPEQLGRFLALVAERHYASAEAAREALARRSMFNIIHFEEGWKADLIIRKDRAFSIEELARRRVQTMYGFALPVASAEDVILTKLEWDMMTPSERQVNDALTVAVVQWPTLDQAYLRSWAPMLGVAEKLEVVLSKAGELYNQQQP